MIRLPKEVLDLFPMWEYKCPECQTYVDSDVLFCPKCKTPFNALKWRVPPRFLESKEAMARYAHEVLAPKLTEKERELLFQYFTVIFTDDFEDCAFGAWTGTEGEPTCVTDYAHHGAYSCKIDAKEGPYKDITTYSTVYGRVYVYFTSLITYDWYTLGIIKIGNAAYWGYAVHAQLMRIDGVNYFQLNDRYAGRTDEAATLPQTGVWYLIELKFSTTANLELYIDETLEATLPSYGGGDADRVAVGLGAYSNVGAVGYIDCVVFADTYIGPEVAVGYSYSDGLVCVSVS